MAIVSGNIGQLIPFNVEQAGAVTGVYFGSGLSQSIQAQSNNETIIARVPDDANWDFVDFYKRPRTTIYGVFGTGLKETGAYSGLNDKVAASGFDPKCTSGVITYSNVYSAVTICNLNATGTTEALASGALYSAYDSGYCGDAGLYTNSGYSGSYTRLNNFNTFEDNDGSWLAIGAVEDTGNFDWQKASADVTCTVQVSESTDYKFVPIPLIASFSPKEGGEGAPLNVYGKALYDVSNISINNSGVTFQVISNTHLSGTIPSGVFNHKIQTVGPSGVTSQSVESFITLTTTPPTAATRVLSLTAGQFTQRNKGSLLPITIVGENITGLSTATLTDQKSNTINLLNDNSFSYTTSALSVPASGLDQGVYDVSVQGAYGSASLGKAISIIDSPVLTQGYISILSTGLINEPTPYDTVALLETAKYNSQYPFSVTEKPDKICVSMKNSGIEGGSVSLSLGYYYDNSFNSTDYYYITATGESVAESYSNALNMYNSGIYTVDEHGDLYDSYSYKLQPCICDIDSSGFAYIYEASSFYHSGSMTGSISGETGSHPKIVPLKALCVSDFNTHAGARPNLSCLQSGFIYSTEILNIIDYTGLQLTATGYSTGITSADILQQLNSYPSYSIVGWVHAYTTFREPNVYRSGINYPFSTSSFENYTLPAWENIRLSGMDDLYPNGYPGGDNLTTSYAHTNTAPYEFNNKLSGLAKTEGAAKAPIEYQLSANYSQCQSGNYSASLIAVTGTISLTGTTYGYC